MRAAVAGLLALLSAPLAMAESGMQMFEDFGPEAGERWQYVADGVMGGVSEGQAVIEGGAVRLTGTVSTKNNGGFIQVRHRFDGLPSGTRGLTLTARGNGEQYWVFLRTRGLTRVWHSYRYAFEAGEDWKKIQMDLHDFTPSHNGMAEGFVPEDVIGIGLVAYGKDFEADLRVGEIGVY